MLLLPYIQIMSSNYVRGCHIQILASGHLFMHSRDGLYEEGLNLVNHGRNIKFEKITKSDPKLNHIILLKIQLYKCMA